ncbi:MAG: hypothetical protein IJW82_07025 [Clostridia bacterium]|nr:hypothetical protein [Clostridia bacterium]
MKYKLYKKVKEFRNHTDISYYCRNTLKIEKHWKPFTYADGERVKQNIETGEQVYYTYQERLQSVIQSVSRTKDRLYALCDANDFDYFITLTFDKYRIDRENPEIVVECYKKYIAKLSRKVPTLRYVTVPELHHDKTGNCLHFHILMGGISAKDLMLTNSGKVCCSWATKKNGICSKEYFEKTKYKYQIQLPNGEIAYPKGTDGFTLYNVNSFHYGLTTATKIANRDKTNSYVRKYLDKGMRSLSKFFYIKKFYYSRNLNMPKQFKYEEMEDNNIIFSLKYAMSHDNYLKHRDNEDLKITYEPLRFNTVKIRVPNDSKSIIDYATARNYKVLSEEENKELEKLFEKEIVYVKKNNNKDTK